jgi:hypothetical protein
MLPLRRQYGPLAVQPHGQVPFGGFTMASAAPGDGVQNEPLAREPCGHEPPGPDGFGTGSGSTSAVVAASASTRESAAFIASFSVLDTIGTLAARSIEIIGAFSLAHCRVMGRKAPR